MPNSVPLVTVPVEVWIAHLVRIRAWIRLRVRMGVREGARVGVRVWKRVWVEVKVKVKVKVGVLIRAGVGSRQTLTRTGSWSRTRTRGLAP